MSFYIGVDFGTSGARAIAIDSARHPVAQANFRFGVVSPEDWGTVWRQTLWDVLAELPAPVRAATAAIAVNGTSSTVMLCDRDGLPITAPLLYNDGRGRTVLPTLHAYFDQWGDRPTPGRDTVLGATSSLVKLLWWQQAAMCDPTLYFLHQADWLAFLLHGQLGVSDYHNALKLGYDVVRLAYPDWLLGLELPVQLPQVVAPGTAIAPVLPAIVHQFGLPVTCQVCAGTTDSIAAFLASGATAPGEAVTSLGSTLVLKLLSETYVEQGESGVYSHRLGDLWLVGGASNTGGAVLQHFFTSAELAQLSAHIQTTQPSPLDYYPLLQPGERFPVNDPTLPPRLAPRPESDVEFLHGLLESMARIEAVGYEQLQRLGATPLCRVWTAGGGATNETWTAIRARLLGVPVGRSPQTEAAYGTALLARQALAVL